MKSLEIEESRWTMIIYLGGELGVYNRWIPDAAQTTKGQERADHVNRKYIKNIDT